jgi:hypothetical protein
MAARRRSITQINVVARRYEETLAFYRLLGIDIPAPVAEPPGALHATANVPSGFALEIDNPYLAGLFNAAWRTSGGGSSLLLCVTVESREEVDGIHATMVSAGHTSRQPPYDAFWGSRFAVVADPEGNDVALMSAPDDAFRSWPPVESPDAPGAE